ncbi:hypothetical protein LTR84_010971 [Exophiala bonariae]|uniref:Uncharacterized protein n=1 Tax=Exophiala bonariae TaxID=1690606 RepID=A0AAV9NIZ4_9EURO|nr:hypothetical protein LTR84_010971 [Exophiala bonariae]
MNPHEIPPPFPHQVHPHLPDGATHPFTESSILDVPHQEPQWTTLTTKPTQNRIIDVPAGSGSAEIDCLRISGDKFCATAIQLTSWGSVHRVLSVPAESPFQRASESTQEVRTRSSALSLLDQSQGPPLSLSTRPPSQLTSSTPATTFQTQILSPFLPSQTSANDLNPSATQLPTGQLQTTPVLPAPTSNEMEHSGTRQSGPIVAYVILGVFFGFGIICALVTNRKIINWVQESVRKRRELEEARRKVEEH